MTVVATCTTEAELDGLTAALRLAGIEPIVNQRTNGSGKYEIAVREEDAERADDIVNRIYGVDAREAEEATVAAAPEVECDVCGSHDVSRTRKLPLFLVALIVALGFALAPELRLRPLAFFVVVGAGIALLVTDTWRCGECGHAWK